MVKAADWCGSTSVFRPVWELHIVLRMLSSNPQPLTQGAQCTHTFLVDAVYHSHQPALGLRLCILVLRHRLNQPCVLGHTAQLDLRRRLRCWPAVDAAHASPAADAWPTQWKQHAHFLGPMDRSFLVLLCLEAK
jgi:hypothetical protein